MAAKKKKEPKFRRPSWDDYFLEVANSISKRSTCNRGRSGCVIVKDNQIVSAGYVGSPPGFPHCDDIGHQMKKLTHEDGSATKHCVRTVHAEQNSICQAAKRGVSVKEATIYCRMTPCRVCAMLLVSSGLKRVYCETRYHDHEDPERIFRKGKVKIQYKNKTIQKYSNQ